MSRTSARKRPDPNRMRPDDHPVHDWYRFVLSFPPHLVRNYLERLDSVGLERNPMAHFASSVKVDWSVDPARLAEYADEVAGTARSTLVDQGVDEWGDLPLLAGKGSTLSEVRTLGPSRSKLLLKNSISPVPLHKTLVVLDAIDRLGDSQLKCAHSVAWPWPLAWYGASAT